MRELELLGVDALYELEMSLLRYPGLHLYSILDHSDVLELRFRGPRFEGKGTMAAVPLSCEIVREGFFDHAIEEAVYGVESLVEAA